MERRLRARVYLRWWEQVGLDLEQGESETDTETEMEEKEKGEDDDVERDAEEWKGG